MKILIIGGTIFLGRRLVEAALARGHTVTTFSRGRHVDGAHPDVESLRGDRNGDVSALRAHHWDAVIDTCGYVPGGVRRVMDASPSGHVSPVWFEHRLVRRRRMEDAWKDAARMRYRLGLCA